MKTFIESIKFYIKAQTELFRESVKKSVYMRKLRFTIKTADQLHQHTKRKYYVVHDIYGDPTIVTATQVNDLKAKGRLPKEWTHLDLEKNAIYIPFILEPNDLVNQRKKRR